MTVLPPLKVQAIIDAIATCHRWAPLMVVVSYGLLLQDAKAFATQTWHSIVPDEAQSIKTRRRSVRGRWWR